MLFLHIMQFEEDLRGKKIGIAMGYAFSYALFTTLLFFLLFFIGKMPPSWTYVHLMPITASVAVLGGVLRRLLK